MERGETSGAFEGWGSSWFTWRRLLFHNKTRKRSLKAIRNNCSDQNVKEFTTCYYNWIHEKVKYGDQISSIPKRLDFRAPKNPVVLCHGLSGFDRLILLPSVGQITKVLSNHVNSNNSEQMLESDFGDSKIKGLLEVEYWFGVKQALEAKGCTVICARVPGFASVEERAKALNECIERETRYLRLSKSPNDIYNTPNGEDNRKPQERIRVNLIAHSMGGLDSRYLISRIPNKNFEVISLTTVSTPHHGSEMADFVVGLSRDVQKGIPRDSPAKILPPAIYQLTTESMREFNRSTPNDPKVAYFSYGASMRPKWFNLFYGTWQVVSNISNGEPNDGLVTVSSSKWGQYMGTLQNTDHLDLINWKNRIQKEVANKVFKVNDSVSNQVEPELDVLDFYLSIADNLARRGF